MVNRMLSQTWRITLPAFKLAPLLSVIVTAVTSKAWRPTARPCQTGKSNSTRRRRRRRRTKQGCRHTGSRITEAMAPPLTPCGRSGTSWCATHSGSLRLFNCIILGSPLYPRIWRTACYVYYLLCGFGGCVRVLITANESTTRNVWRDVVIILLGSVQIHLPSITVIF